MKHIFERICAKEDLTFEQSETVFQQIIRGELTDIQISSLLTALKVKGETPHEIAGASSALRKGCLPFERPNYRYADTCGTGGDGAKTLNISTAVAFVASACGLPVAKHGNVAVSSSCGSADVLKYLGVKLDVSSQVARQCLDDIGVCFLLAPVYHTGIKHAMPVRKELGVRTLFNLLGPLCNPANPQIQMIGVPKKELCRPIADAAAHLGIQTVLVVHGSGLDEIAVHDVTYGVLCQNGESKEIEVTPETFGISKHPIETILGGSVEENARWMQRVLLGKATKAQTDAVAVNAGTVLWLAGIAVDIREGAALALDAMKSGRSLQKLDMLVEATHGAE